MHAALYAFCVAPSESGGWSIWFPDLPGCRGWALTWEDIGQEAKAAAEGWLASERERGHAIPAPAFAEPDDTWPQGFAAMTAANPQPDPVLDVADVARILEVTPRRVQALAKHRGLGRKVGNALAFTPADVDRMKNRRNGRPVAAQPQAVAAD